MGVQTSEKYDTINLLKVGGFGRRKEGKRFVMKDASCRKISKISTLHYFKLVFRSALFLSALILYVRDILHGGEPWFETVRNYPALLNLIWIVFALEMVARCFPSGIESMGCQKLFARNYIPQLGCNVKAYRVNWKVTFAMAAAWLALNGAIGLLYWLEWIDEGILLLIALAYSVCDMICILFFCPFQTWFMKNKCCGTCRIYNWDFAMMFTPLAFVKHAYTWSLLGIALVVLLQWEITYRIHPERFYDGTNQSLLCVNCKEKLCHHKTQLKQFAKLRK